MEISLIAAMDEGRVIGRDNDVPWSLPDEMAWFKSTTVGKPIIMGRRTWESFGGRPLPRRPHLVVTSARDCPVAPGVHVVASLDEALELCRDAPEVFVIGGTRLYAEALPRASRLYLTTVHAHVEGDTWFPDFDRGAWREVWRQEHPVDPRHAHPYTSVILERASSPAAEEAG